MAARKRQTGHAVGIVGWNYPEWRGLILPAGAKPPTFLSHYAKLFPTVEVASSYYRAPDASSAAKWASETPEGFVFSLKVPDWITRSPGDARVAEGLASFVEALSSLRDAKKLGALVAQFTPAFRRDKKADDLRAFVQALPRGEAWAIELRHESWWHQDTYKLLEDAGVTLVWSSVESGRTPPIVTSDSLYLRLFGDRALQPPYDRKRRDKRDELAHWAARVKDEGASTKRADIMLSKFLEGYAPGSAATMCELLGLPVPDVGDRAGRKATKQKKLD